jgi:hypothetical protein
VLASLNHPHIAAIYGLEEAGGSTFLVLELSTAGRSPNGSPGPRDGAADAAR